MADGEEHEDDGTLQVDAQAKAWIDALASGGGVAGAWRLEVTETRTRMRRPDGGGDPVPTTLPVRIRRFAKGIPRGLVDDAIRYLVSCAPYSGMVYNGEPVAGEYLPTRTFWRRDDQEAVSQRAAGTYTLVQDLIERTEAGDSYSVRSSSSCTEEVTSDWHWDEFSIEDAGDGGQGVTVAVQAVSRNEDGTFNYAVVTRTAITQCSGWQTVECDEFKTVERCQWQNVYGTPESPSSRLETADSTLELEPPSPCVDRSPGVLYEVQWDKNDDCTWRVVATRTTSKEDVTAERRVSATVYEKDVSTTTRLVAGQPSHLPEVPAAPVDGRIVETRRELQPDGRSVETVSEKAEQAVESAKRSVRKTLRGVVRVNLDRSQPAGEIPPAAGLGVGDAVEVTVTDGGRYDVETTTALPESVGQIGAMASQTAFQSEAELRRNLTKDDAARQLDVDVGRVPAGRSVTDVSVRDGVVRRTEASMTDAGAVDVSERATEFKTVRTAAKQVRKTLRGTVTTVRDRSVPAMPDMDPDKLPIGGSIEATMNDAERYDVETVLPSEPAGDLAAMGTQTTYRTTAEKRENVEYSDASALLDVDVSGAPSGTVVTRTAVSGGVIRKIEATVTDAGSVDVTEQAERHVPVESAVVRRSATLTATVVETTNRNMPVPDEGPVDVGESVESVLNDAGLYDVTRKSRDSTAVLQQSAETLATPFLRSAQTRFSYQAEQGSGIWGIQAGALVGRVAYLDGPGRRVRKSVERGSDGEYIVTDTIEEEKEGGITSSVELATPYTKTLHITFGRVHPDNLQALLTGGDFGAQVQEWAGSVSGGDLGTTPTGFKLDISVNEDAYGLMGGTAVATLIWPAGSAGADGQFGDEIYFDLQVAETRMAAGRGQRALENFFNSSSWQALMPSLQGYVNTVQAILSSYASFLGWEQDTSVLLGLPQFPTYTIEAANASLAHDTGQWTASYRDINIDQLYSLVLNMLPRAICTLVAMVNLDAYLRVMTAEYETAAS